MLEILKYELEVELVDKKINNSEKKEYHFIVLNEHDKNNLDPIMYFFESNLSSDEILNKSYIVGTFEENEEKVELAIPTHRIKEIVTYQNKDKVLEEYKIQRYDIITTRDIQINNQEEQVWNMLKLNEEYGRKTIKVLDEQIEELLFRDRSYGLLPSDKKKLERLIELRKIKTSED